MKILIAPNAFKNAATATEVAGYLRDGILDILPETEIVLIPLADGGQGTVEALTEATNGRIIPVRVMDPLMRETDAFFGITGDGKTAVIEMAAASGIERLKPGELNPLTASTFGTGQLITAALDAGCKKIIIGIGGSATNDGGMGMACALGVRFTDSENHIVPQGGGFLGNVARIDTSGMDQRIRTTEIIAACDVTNPLTGPEGASCIYGPQKGADPGMVKTLDRNLSVFAGKIREQLDTDIEFIPGAGAAGGLGGGLMVFCGAKLMNGFDIISQLTGLEEKIQHAGLIITGEGKIDRQTQYGKTVAGVAGIALKYHKPVVAVAGTIGEDADVLYRLGIDLMFSILRKPVSLVEAVKSTPVLLRLAGNDIARMVKLRIKTG